MIEYAGGKERRCERWERLERKRKESEGDREREIR